MQLKQNPFLSVVPVLKAIAGMLLMGSTALAQEYNCNQFNQISLQQLIANVRKLNECAAEASKAIGLPKPSMTLDGGSVKLKNDTLFPPFYTVDGSPSYRYLTDETFQLFRIARTGSALITTSDCYQIQCWRLKDGKTNTNYFLRADDCHSHNRAYEIMTSCKGCDRASAKCSEARIEKVSAFHTKEECLHALSIYGSFTSQPISALLDLHLRGFFKPENKTTIKLIHDKCKLVENIPASFSNESSSRLTAVSSDSKQEIFNAGKRLADSPLFTNLKAILDGKPLTEVPGIYDSTAQGPGPIDNLSIKPAGRNPSKLEP